jgi:hypothetical protein
LFLSAVVCDVCSDPGKRSTAAVGTASTAILVDEGEAAPENDDQADDEASEWRATCIEHASLLCGCDARAHHSVLYVIARACAVADLSRFRYMHTDAWLQRALAAVERRAAAPAQWMVRVRQTSLHGGDRDALCALTDEGVA